MVFVGPGISQPWYQNFGGGGGGGGGGGAPTDAHYLTSLPESGLSNEVVFGSVVFYPPDILANRPSAGSTIVGAIYFATDGGGTAGQGALYRSDGVGTWDRIAIDKEWADALYQPLDAELTALAGLTSAADKFPYFTGSGTASTTTVTSFSRSLLDDVDAATWATDLGILTVVDGTKIDTTSGASTITFDVDLSEGKSGGDTLIGGTGASENMLIGSTSNSTRGFIQLRDYVQIATENKTNTTTTPVAVLAVPSTTTFTLADNAGGLNVGNQVIGLSFAATVQWTNNGNSISQGLFFNNAGVFKNTLGSTPTFTGTWGTFAETATYEADTQTITWPTLLTVASQPTITTINSGTYNVTAFSALRSNITVGAGATVATASRILINNFSGGGAVTTDIGVDIGTLATAGTGIGIRNASRYVATPTVDTITAVGNTIGNTSEVRRLNNTSGGSLTLTSAPTIADGVDGQFLYLVNVSTQNIVIQDQATLASSNLRLAATQRTLTQRDGILLFYTSGLGDWVEVAFTNNL